MPKMCVKHTEVLGPNSHHVEFNNMHINPKHIGVFEFVNVEVDSG